MFQQCVNCSEQAIKRCSCSDQVFCEKHGDEHALTAEVHSINYISYPLSTEERQKLTNVALRHINLIEKCKKRIVKHTFSLISHIENLSSKAQENLSKLALSYQQLLKNHEYSASQMNDIQKLLNSKFCLDFNPDLESLNKFEEYFAQQFYRISPGSLLTDFLKTHAMGITCMAVTSDNKKIYAGGSDHSIKIWSVANSEVFSILEGHKSAIFSLALSENNSLLVSGSADTTVRVWNTSDLRQLCILREHTLGVTSVAVSEDCEWIASGGGDTSICVWSIKEQRLFHKLIGHTDCVTEVLFSSKCLLTVSFDKTIREWDYINAEQSSVLQAPGEIRSFDVSENLFVTGMVRGKILIWENKSMKVKLNGHSDMVCAVKFTSKNTLIISASEDKTVCVWKIDQQSRIACFANHSARVWCLAHFCDDLFVSGSDDASMIVWNTSTLSMHSKLESQPFTLSDSLLEKNLLIYILKTTVLVWNLEKNCLEAEFQHSKKVRCVAFDAGLIVSGSSDETVRVWSLCSRTQVALLNVPEATVYGVAIRQNTVASGSLDGTIRVWDVADSQAKGVLKAHDSCVYCVALSRNKEIGASGSADWSVKVWRVGELQILHSLAGHCQAIRQVGISGDDRYLVSGSDYDNTVRVWELNSGAEVGVWKTLDDGEKWLVTYPELRWLTEKVIC
jgi:WD40 repeat protein